jgi:hypothetical protein
MDAEKPSFYSPSRSFGASRVHGLCAILEATHDDLSAIPTRKYLNWLKPLRLRRLASGEALCFHVLIDGYRHRVKCEMDKTAFATGQRQICISLQLSKIERSLLAAVGARDGHEVRLHVDTKN